MIEVTCRRDSDPQEFLVVIRDEEGQSRHAVTVSSKTLQRLTRGDNEPERLVEAAFRFLLDREPKESILPHFDLSVISRYFPEFERELPTYL